MNDNTFTGVAEQVNKLPVSAGGVNRSTQVVTELAVILHSAFYPPDNTHISLGQSMPCYTSNELYNDLQKTSAESCCPLRLWCE